MTADEGNETTGHVDETDQLVARWTEAVPTIDPAVEGVVDRVLICARYLDRLARQLSEPHDIHLPDYEVLARLFWVGPPHRLRPTQLATGTMTAPTTVTSRLDRLQKRGLIQRVADPTDRRAMSAELTDEGRQLFIGIVKKQAEAERETLADLPPEKMEALASLLSDALVAFENHHGPPPRRVRLAMSEE